MFCHNVNSNNLHKNYYFILLIRFSLFFSDPRIDKENKKTVSFFTIYIYKHIMTNKHNSQKKALVLLAFAINSFTVFIILNLKIY